MSTIAARLEVFRKSEKVGGGVTRSCPQMVRRLGTSRNSAHCREVGRENRRRRRHCGPFMINRIDRRKGKTRGRRGEYESERALRVCKIEEKIERADDVRGEFLQYVIISLTPYLLRKKKKF